MTQKVRQITIKWLAAPEKQDYPAAYSFLSLIFAEKTVSQYVKRLKRAPVLPFKAKDIFRASSLELLGADNYHVRKDRKRIQDGASLSPILLVRETDTRRVIIADGYHRMCAVYSFDEDAVIPCKVL